MRLNLQRCPIHQPLATCGQRTSTLWLVNVFYNLNFFKLNLEMKCMNFLSRYLNTNKVYFNSHISVQDSHTFQPYMFNQMQELVYRHIIIHTISVHINGGVAIQASQQPQMWLARKSYWTPLVQYLVTMRDIPLVLKVRPSLGLIVCTKVFCPQHTLNTGVWPEYRSTLFTTYL